LLVWKRVNAYVSIAYDAVRESAPSLSRSIVVRAAPPDVSAALQTSDPLKSGWRCYRRWGPELPVGSAASLAVLWPRAFETARQAGLREVGELAGAHFEVRLERQQHAGP
jgi:hypothetical protein